METKEEQEVDHFDEIMTTIGYGGFFQKMFNMIYVTSLTFFTGMMCMNFLLALNAPTNWCHVPGRNNTNFTLEEWKEITLPKSENNRGERTFSSCLMYDLNFTDIQHWDYKNWNFRNIPITNCRHGHEYDQQWYLATIVTQENWVCEKDLYVTHTFTISRIAEVIGTFVFGQLGDTIGRKIVYYISAIFAVTGRLSAILTTSSFVMFTISSVVTSLAVNGLFQSPLIIAMETSREDDRANIAMAQNLGWAFGQCVMPLIFWYFRDWVPFMWITSAPIAVFFVFSRFMIESPRWLISKKRFKDAVKQFRIMAKINGSEFTMTEKELTERYLSTKQEQTYGMMSLFSGWRIARNTMIMALNWCVVVVVWFTLMLFCSSLAGNPFLNFFLQTIVEIPANIVGKFFGNKIGRRFTSCLSYSLAILFCIPLIVLSKYPKYELVVTFLAVLLKFFNGITFFAMGLQAMETYPTCLRQSGMALGVIAGNSIGVVAPYVVYLGTTYDIRYPFYILLILYIVGASSVLFLPETLHHKLPDTLEEAKKFGKGQSFWKLPRPVKDSASSETEKLNQKRFAP